MRIHWFGLFYLAMSLGVVVTSAQRGEQPSRKVFYVAKPLKPAPYRTPMKPLVRLADLKTKHKGQSNWSELVVDDKNNRVEVISMAPGSKVARHLHSDAPEFWVVQQGRLRFEIETDSPGKFQTIEAGVGSLVFAAERHLHSMEVIGAEPAIRFQVALAESTPVFETKPAVAEKGMEYVPVTLSTGVNPDDVPNPEGKPDRLFFNVPEMWKEHEGRKSWSDLAIRKNRAHANIICGYAAANRNPADRGHYHTDFDEIWIVLQGQQRWSIEGLEPFVAGEGDVVYAPATRWHLPEPYGEGPSCRLAITPYPAGNHFYDPPAAANGR